jgi:hypothetical protein
MWASTDGKDKDQAQEPHQNIQDKGKDESSNPISHEDFQPIWVEDGIFFVSLGPRIFILKSIGGQINLNSRWLLKDEEAIDWRRRFRSFHWARGTSSRKVIETFQGRKESFGWGVCVCVFLGERKKEEKERVISFYVWKVLFMIEMCARIKHGKISMTKPWSFISNSCSSQINRWNCVKLQKVLV